MKPAVICIGSTDWEGMNHRPHHMMRGLASRGWQVVYVNPPMTWLSPIKERSLLGKWSTQWSHATVEPDITVLQAPVVAPFGSMWPGSNIWNQHRIVRAIEGLREELGIEAYVLYTLLPGSVDLLPLLGGDVRVVYDCVDDHAEFTGLIVKEYVREQERRLAEQADAVLSTSGKLQRRLQPFNENVYLLPNGVHVGHFAPTPDLRERGAVWKQQLGAEVVIGFVGGIANWIDLEILAGIARLRPQYTLALVGPVLTALGELERLPNVRVLGQKPYADLPAILQAFDVGLSPFVLNDLTESVNPVKVYEYLAASLEVVATPMAELLPMSDAIHFGSTPEEFVRELDGILDGTGNKPESVRHQIALDNSWDHRIAETDRILRGICSDTRRQNGDHRRDPGGRPVESFATADQ